MAPVNRKHPRASSDELESILFTASHSTLAGHNGGGVSSSSQDTQPAKCVQLTARKGGWDAAGKPAHQRTIQEYTAKKPRWQQKLAKCKNALARSIVQNAFITYTPNGWSGKRFPTQAIVPEKERGMGAKGQSIVGRGVKAQATATSINKRFKTYLNDALRYAKIVSKVDRFERWSKTRKLEVRDTVEQEMDRLKVKELGV